MVDCWRTGFRYGDLIKALARKDRQRGRRSPNLGGLEARNSLYDADDPFRSSKDIPAPKISSFGWSIISTTIELVLPRVGDIDKVMKLTELIDSAPWREAVTYRDTWPHEYVLSKKDGDSVSS